MGLPAAAPVPEDQGGRGRLPRDLAREARKGTRDDFILRYRHPWLLQEIEGDVHASPALRGFKTRLMPLVERSQPPTRLSVLQSKLAGAPERMLFLSICKGQANPWQDRILVGRAVNNDVILRHPSVSKIHAYFIEMAPGRWWLEDAKSSNGTFIEGAKLRPGEGLVISAGTTIQFAALSCHFVEAGTAFDLLSTLPRVDTGPLEPAI